MNALAMIWSAAIQAGLASLMFSPPYGGSGALYDVSPPARSCNFDHRPPAVFLHVPALDDASEIIPSPTGKGATR